MILLPAIDLKEGACVRLLRGRMETATLFNANPAAQAETFRRAGFSWLHVVDLDGARAGRSVNAGAIEAILAATDAEVQLGGGIRHMAAVEHWIGRGVRRVILGTAALHNPEFVKAACRAHPDRVAVSLDTRGGRVAVDGWSATSEVPARELALRFEDAGVAALIHTDIDRDGTLEGINSIATYALASAVQIPVLASGGVSSLDDLVRLRAVGRIAGVICGRALYEGRVTPDAALAAFSAERQEASSGC
jgi:phosphoribosylformimino-5-aminoimidazole carboxamide ribotide isomerase